MLPSAVSPASSGSGRRRRAKRRSGAETSRWVDGRFTLAAGILAVAVSPLGGCADREELPIMGSEGAPVVLISIDTLRSDRLPAYGYRGVETPALDALARLGYTLEQPKVAAAMEYLLSRQLPDGTWPQDQSAYRPPFDVGPPGQPSKWLTLDALRVAKLLSDRD